MSDDNSKMSLGFFREKRTNFPQKPKIVDDIDIFEMPDGLGFQFRGLMNPVLMRGALVDKALPHLLKLLDGTRNLDDLQREIFPLVDHGELATLLMNLFMKGLIVECESAPDQRNPPDAILQKQASFWSRRLGITRFNIDAREVSDKIKAAKILLLGEGMLGATIFDLLINSGFERVDVISFSDDSYLTDFLAEDDVILDSAHRDIAGFSNALPRNIESFDLVICALGNVSNDFFEIVNDYCLQNEIQSLRVQDNGSWIDCGPYVNPFDTPCLTCLMTRQACVGDNAIEEELYQHALLDNPEKGVLRGELLSLSTAAAAYIVQDVQRIITGIGRPFLGGKVVKFSFDGNIDSFNFKRVAQCESCSRGRVVKVMSESVSRKD